MEEMIQKALNKGVEMHLAGNFDLARQLYASVIEVQPEHCDANHNMGLLKLDMDENLDALPHLQTALQADNSVAQFWLSYGKALIKLERLDEAAKLFDLAKKSGIKGEEFFKLNQLINTLKGSERVAEAGLNTPSQSDLNILDSFTLDRTLKLARKHIKEGDYEKAKRMYNDILAIYPKNSRAQQGLVNLNKLKQSIIHRNPPEGAIKNLINLYHEGQLSAAVKQAQALTQKYPDVFMVWNVLGASQKGLGKLYEASQAFKRVTELNPTYADGFNNFGVTLKEQGMLEEALQAYNKALTLKPDYPEVFNNIGNALKDQNKLTEAIASYENALSLNPNYAEAQGNIGIILQEQSRLEEAIHAYKKALALKPDYAEAYNYMGYTLNDQGKLTEAIASYKKAISLKPDYAEAYNNMGIVLQEQGKLEQAVEAYNKAIYIKPDYADCFNNLGVSLKDQGKLDEAIASYEKTLSLKPECADVYSNMGVALKDQGKLEEAIKSYKKALSLKPGHAEAHRHLSSLIKYKPYDTQVISVGEMIERADLHDSDRCNLHYTYAKMSEDFGDLDAAFDNYVAGGKLRKKLLRYNFKQDKRVFDKIKNRAPDLKEYIFDMPNEEPTNIPIFILGMPRSGTTLVEQIITSHSQVHGAGELKLLNRFGGSLSLGNQNVNSENILQIRNAYLNELEKISHGYRFVTDKMPQNFLYIGLIFKAMPEAKIIHVKRNSAATCWSNFKHYFAAKGLGYSYDLNDTVSYFKRYQDLMDFWNQQYRSQIYHLDYDKLTVEQEPEIRRLLEYIELSWEDACLSPQKNKRSVKTASQQQVRKKVYTGSSQAWRKFQPYLTGIFDEIDND